jgi:hypothetical protein
MPAIKSDRSLWPILVLLAAVPRILGAFFLPNAFGDAYVYIRDIGTLSTKLAAGTFRPTDLFGFWLPLYQMIAAVVNVLVKNGFYSGKIVSAVFGIGACLFIYLITLQLTQNAKAAVLIFLLIALNPLHIFYSASAMTDVPHACLVLGALYFVLTGNWVTAAVFAALAGLTRVESWMFIAIIPLLQFLRERRISLVSLIIMIVPPLFWFYISWKATGDVFACFRQRQQYLVWLLGMNPAIAHFSVVNILRDGATLLISSDIAVLLACFIAGGFVLRKILKTRRLAIPEEVQTVLAPVVFFFAFFALLVVAYLTHQQPIIFPRYGLILFSLGLPLLAWVFLRLREKHRSWARRLAIGVIVICAFDASVQFVGAVGTINQYRAQRRVADYLRTRLSEKPDAQIFCDEGTVRALSGIPLENFLTSDDAPGDRRAFLKFIKERQVAYLVFIKRSDSIPAQVFPDLESQEPEPFELLMHSYCEFLPTDIWVYSVK